MYGMSLGYIPIEIRDLIATMLDQVTGGIDLQVTDRIDDIIGTLELQLNDPNSDCHKDFSVINETLSEIVALIVESDEAVRL